MLDNQEVVTSAQLGIIGNIVQQLETLPNPSCVITHFCTSPCHFPVTRLYCLLHCAMTCSKGIAKLISGMTA